MNEITVLKTLKSIQIIATSVSIGWGLCLAIDVYQAVDFAINEQNKTTDHHEDGDQKE